MGKVLHTPMDILRLILIDANYDHSFPVHTDLEIQVPTWKPVKCSQMFSI